MIVVGLFSSTHLALAGEIEEPMPPLNSDRPSFTSASSTVATGYDLFELGVQLDTDSSGKSLTVPQALVRMGLGQGFEFRVTIPSITANWPKQGVVGADITPLELGAKLIWNLGDVLALGILPFASIPLKSSQYDSAGAALGFRFIWGASITDRLSINGDLGMTFGGLGAQDTNQEYLASLMVSFAMTGWMGGFLEAYTDFTDGQERVPVFANAGLAFAIGSRWQLDMVMGTELRDGLNSWSIGVGGALLW